MNTSATATFNVYGQAMTDNVTLTLNDANGVFSINPTEISAADAANGKTVTVTFDPVATTDYNATNTPFEYYYYHPLYNYVLYSMYHKI